MGIYGLLDTTAAECTFFSSGQATVRRQTIFGAIKQVSINLKRLKLYKTYVLATMKIEISHRKVPGKSPNM